MKEDLISRQDAIDAVDDWWITVDDNRHPVSVIKALPSAQPEITEEQAIEHLQSTGWMQRHDRILTESTWDIIHCKDCKYWQDQEEGIVEVPICARPQNKYEKFPLVMLIDGDGFCSYAERKENR